MVMGLFGFIGKAVKAVGKVVGGVAKVGLGVAKLGLSSGLLPIPGGGVVGRALGAILQAKAKPRSTPLIKTVAAMGVGAAGMRGHTATYAGPVSRTPPPVLRRSPVMPGGAVATKAGVAPRPASGNPPAAWTGSGVSPKKKRKKAKKRSGTSSKRRKSTKRRAGSKRGYRTYRGRRYSAKQAKYFLPKRSR